MYRNARTDSTSTKRVGSESSSTVVASTVDEPCEHAELAHLIIRTVSLLWKKPANMELATDISFILQHLNNNQESIVHLAIIYIMRLRANTPNHSLKLNYESRIIIGALILSQKYLEDARWTNQTWAIVAGIKRDDINQMERDFLGHLKWDMFVSHVEMSSEIKSLKISLHRMAFPCESWPTPPHSPNTQARNEYQHAMQYNVYPPPQHNQAMSYPQIAYTQQHGVSYHQQVPQYVNTLPPMHIPTHQPLHHRQNPFMPGPYQGTYQGQEAQTYHAPVPQYQGQVPSYYPRRFVNGRPQ